MINHLTMKPEVLAVAILTLIIVAFAGTYIIKTSKSGIKENFDAASRTAALACEKSYNECLRAGTSNTECTKQSSLCLTAITNPSVSTATPAASKGTGSSSSAAAAGTSGGNRGTYDASGNPTGATLTNYNELYKLVSASAENRGQTGANSSYSQAVATLTPEFKNFLKQVQANIATKVEDPTKEQLALAQGAGVAPVASATPSYTPSATIIKPHEKVPLQLPTMTANLSTDKGTQAQEIAMNNIYTPSIRQMIRDDVKEVVREEVEANQINNPYAVNYESY
jgi:hypothetical protein